MDTSKVYSSGRHFIGPDYTFKKFRADAHFVELNKVAVFTKDKVEIIITCNFQYFLKKDFLPDLHEAYNVDYKPIIRSTAIDALKGRAAQLAVDDYIRSGRQQFHVLVLSLSNATFPLYSSLIGSFFCTTLYTIEPSLSTLQE